MQTAQKEQNLSGRIYGARIAKGWSQRELAEKSGLSLRTVQNYEADEFKNPQGAKLRRIAAALELPLTFLLNGEVKGNVTIVPLGKTQRVPVVSWAHAGEGGNYGDLAEQLGEWIDSDCKDPNAYALIIEGDSMEPKFSASDRVIFLPNQEPANGDVVVARVERSGDVFFKLFHTFGTKGEMVRLTSFNPAYPPLEFARREFRFIHPMHSLMRRWRR